MTDIEYEAEDASLEEQPPTTKLGVWKMIGMFFGGLFLLAACLVWAFVLDVFGQIKERE